MVIDSFAWFEFWNEYNFVFFAGELSEEQKQQLEKNRALVMHKENELIESRQQLAKLSQIIDQQGAEIKTISTEMRWASN